MNVQNIFRHYQKKNTIKIVTIVLQKSTKNQNLYYYDTLFIITKLQNIILNVLNSMEYDCLFII